MRSREQVVDELLVLGAQARQVEAFDRLAARWHPRLLRHAWRLTGDPEGAQEAVQEAWMAVARGLWRLKDPGCFGPWALRIVSRRCADWIGRRWRTRLRTTGLDAASQAQAPADTHADDRERVREALRGRMWWIGAAMMANLLVGTVLAVICAVQFLSASDVPDMIRWGAGFFFCLVVVVGAKLGYWMQVARISTAREVKRLELLIAHLAAELHGRT
jgi:DNA-directed RNA polymerase specialized sigma24 family protein